MKSTITTRIYRPTPRNFALLARVLAEGGLVAAPTETVYGLAADALNPKACRAIFCAKGRPADDPLIVHVDSLKQATEIAEFGPEARLVAERFWPGPLTLVLPKKPQVPEIVTSGLPSVAVRMPDHPAFRELIRRSGCALAAPSANPFGYVSPTTAAHVLDGLGGRIGHVLDGGAALIGVESTILDLRDPKRPALLRPGAISREALQAVLGRRIPAYKRVVQSKTAAIAPGLLEKHYSPHTPLVLAKRLDASAIRQTPTDEALLFMHRPQTTSRSEIGKNVFWLTDRKRAKGLEQAAHNLFEQLRTLDHQGWKRIHAEVAPGESALAIAINDRLSRAAAKR